MATLIRDMKSKSPAPAQREEALEWAVSSERQVRAILRDLVDLIETKVHDHGCKLTGLELGSLTSATTHALQVYRHLEGQ